MSKIRLIIDDRESKVYDLFKEIEGVKISIKRIAVGDYIISKGETILCCIERKTFVDFASSIKDGRYLNKEKMVALRKSNGCKLFLIVEGTPAWPSDKTKFARISYRSIEGAMLHMAVFDDFSIFRTQDEGGTVQLIERLAVIYAKANLIEGGDTVEVKRPVLAGLKSATAAATMLSVLGSSGGKSEDDSDLKTIADTCKEIDNQTLFYRSPLQALPGIGTSTAIAVHKKYTLADLILGKIPTTSIKSFKLPSGKALSAKAERTLLNIATSKELSDKILKAIDGIGPTTINQLYNNFTSVADIIKYLLKHDNLSEQFSFIDKSKRSRFIKRMEHLKKQVTILM